MTLIKSMTGSGRSVETRNGREFTVEVRSVNNRYLYCAVRLPRLVAFGEDAVKQAVKNTISRGKVDVYVSVRSEGGEQGTVTLNTALAEGDLAAMRQMAETFGLENDVKVSDLSRLPEVFTVDKPEVDEEALLADLMAVANEALAGYDAMRTTEGAALDHDLRSRGARILELVGQVEKQSPKTVSDYRARLEAKLREVLANTAIDESRILTEAAIFADRPAPLPLKSDERHAGCRRGCGPEAGFPAPGNEPGGQHHRLQVHRCGGGPYRGGHQRGAGKYPGTGSERGVSPCSW